MMNLRCLSTLNIVLSVITLLLLPMRSEAISFAGGMFGGGRYLQTKTEGSNGIAWGLGGKLHFPIGKHLQVGGMGFTDKLTYSTIANSESYISSGMGGVTAEYAWKLSKVNISAGVLFGGGKVRTLKVLSQDTQDSITAIYKSSSSMIISPLISLEYHVSSHMSVMMLSQWIEAVKEADQLDGLSVKIGILFHR